jgi:hypothetical protein
LNYFIKRYLVYKSYPHILVVYPHIYKGCELLCITTTSILTYPLSVSYGLWKTLFIGYSYQ